MEELSKEILDLVTEYGRLLFSVDDVAVIIGIDKQKARHWAKSPSHAFMQAYLKGRLITEAEVRKTTITLAKQGSTPAVEQVKKYIRDSKIENC